jgi:hypothetical protein
MNRKDRRHSGRMQPQLLIKDKRERILNEALEPDEYWDDWNDYRDSMRYDPDKTHIRSAHGYMRWKDDEVKKFNKKNEKLLSRRKIMKVKRQR